MIKNMSQADRVIRLLIALLILILYLTDQISGSLAIILGIIAVIFFVTSFLGTCFVYMPLSLSTRRKNK